MAEATVPAVPNPAPEEKHPDGSPIVKGSASTQWWPTEAKATEIAKARIKGARRAYSVTGKDGKTRFATATHHHFLMEYMMEGELGFVVTEIGKPARASAPVSADSMSAAINSLPEAEREAVKKQLLALLSGKK